MMQGITHMASIIEKIDKMYEAHTQDEVEAWMLEQRDRLQFDDANVRDYIAVCNELGSFYRERSRYGESIHNYGQALEKTVELFGTRRVHEYAVLLINEAGTYRYQRDFARALANYAEAQEILESLSLQDSYEYASLLNNMALTLQDKGGEPERALQLATTSHSIMRREFSGQAQEAISLVNLAAMALRANDLDKARTYAQRAVAIYDALGKTSGHYPAAINIEATVALKSGNLQAALEGFMRSAAFTKKKFGENRDYASALMNMSLVYQMMGDQKMAAEYAQRAAEIKGSFQ